MNSEERRAARRARREAKRAAKKARRNSGISMEKVADLNSLCLAAIKSSKGVRWKASVQWYMCRVLFNVVKMRRNLLEGNEIHRGFYRFDLIERGVLRHIASVHFSERVAHKSLNQNALVPAIFPSMVHSNTANVKGKGMHYAAKLMKMQLADAYRKYGTEFYILMIDVREYFATIPHDTLERQYSVAIPDPRVSALACHLVDVQGGERGLGLGAEPNQTGAVSYLNPVDHLVIEMCGVDAYARYMDDTRVIHPSKEYLQVVLAIIQDRYAQLGLEVHPKKTQIVKASRGFVFLKRRFFFTDTGSVIVKPVRESVTSERRKLKAQRKQYDRGEIDLDHIHQSYQSWRGGLVKSRKRKGSTHVKVNAQKTVESMDALFAQLFNQNDPTGGGRSLPPAQG